MQKRSCFRIALSFVAVGFFAAGIESAKAATTVFTDNFLSGAAAAEFGGAGSVVSVGGYDGINGFTDNFLFNDTIGNPATATTLSLSGLATHTMMTVSFDLALIDSWDGAKIGSEDFFNLSVDGPKVFAVSIDNASSINPEVVPPAATNRIALAERFGNAFSPNFFDSGFTVSLTLAHSAATASLDFFADGPNWSGLTDESWAIDNVTVTTNADVSAVPLPAALPLFASGLGLLGLLGWRRKRSAAA